MYGDRDDPYAALSRLGQRLGADVAPAAVLTTIVSAVAEALRVPHVAIGRAHGAGFELAAAHGDRGRGEPERVPLVSRGETVGRLVVESRAPGDPLRSDERRLRADLARQAATAVDAARLTNDLQRSRERLVVAREGSAVGCGATCTTGSDPCSPASCCNSTTRARSCARTRRSRVRCWPRGARQLPAAVEVSAATRAPVEPAITSSLMPEA
ncbi:MAG: GAF domain-containing protein [Actinomycetota bacterium]|nr:GAF domain-containing protein [Actinomycetota bacterium]